jgi:hypothetical protein
MAWNPLDWFGGYLNAVGDLSNPAQAGKDAATAAAKAQTGLAGWLASVAGDIASGLEGAMVAVFGDLWDVIVGPVEVIAGAIIIVIVLGWAMKNQIIQLGGIALRAAA